MEIAKVKRRRPRIKIKRIKRKDENSKIKKLYNVSIILNMYIILYYVYKMLMDDKEMIYISQIVLYLIIGTLVLYIYAKFMASSGMVRYGKTKQGIDILEVFRIFRKSIRYNIIRISKAFWQTDREATMEYKMCALLGMVSILPLKISFESSVVLIVFIVLFFIPMILKKFKTTKHKKKDKKEG